MTKSKAINFALFWINIIHLTLSQRRPISYRNQSIDLQGKSMDWFLYDIGLRRERFNLGIPYFPTLIPLTWNKLTTYSYAALSKLNWISGITKITNSRRFLIKPLKIQIYMISLWQTIKPPKFYHLQVTVLHLQQSWTTIEPLLPVILINLRIL